jgi:hypothetical protein
MPKKLVLNPLNMELTRDSIPGAAGVGVTGAEVVALQQRRSQNWSILYQDVPEIN